MSQYCDHLDVSFCERDSFEAIFDDAPDYVGFAQAVTSTRILGYFASVEALTESVPNPNIGDTYGIGEEAPYSLYVYSANGWIDNGVPSGPPGPPGPQGNDGAQGPPGPAAAVTAWEIKYQASASGTTIPTGTWSENIPEVPDGQFLWTRTEVTYSDGTTTTSYSVVRGVRGVGLLNITTEPSSYTTVTGGFTPAYRIALSTVKSQSRATEVLVGDTLRYSYYTYPVGYVDASYVYTGVRVSIRGADGKDGKDGTDASVTPENIKSALGYTPAMVNPNLLDNWYFSNPINQRGQTSYTGLAYGIDRWSGRANTIVVTIEDDGVTVSQNSSYASLKQVIDNHKQLEGKTLTMSVLCQGASGDGFALALYNGATVYGRTTHTLTGGVDLISETVVFANAGDYLNLLVYPGFPAEGKSVKIFAIKLELGDTQTLAHQKNGKWVLNEIPNYGEQLARCQRYYIQLNPSESTSSYPGGLGRSETAVALSFILPVAMRTKPTITMTRSSGGKIGLAGKGNIIYISSFYVDSITLNIARIYCQIESGGVANELYNLLWNSDMTIAISADL